MKQIPHSIGRNLEALEKEVVIETYRSRGPGGQRKNKTETAVRLTHLPSGIVVIATEHRSQAQNRKLAFERLRERLFRLHRRKKQRIPTHVSRAAVERRIEAKKTRAQKKVSRRRPEIEKDE